MSPSSRQSLLSGRAYFQVFRLGLLASLFINTNTRHRVLSIVDTAVVHSNGDGQQLCFTALESACLGSSLKPTEPRAPYISMEA